MDNIFGIPPSKPRAICENEKQNFEVVLVQYNACYPKTNGTGGCTSTCSANTCTEVSKPMNQHEGRQYKVYTMFVEKDKENMDKDAAKNRKISLLKKFRRASSDLQGLMPIA